MLPIAYDPSHPGATRATTATTGQTRPGPAMKTRPPTAKETAKPMTETERTPAERLEAGTWLEPAEHAALTRCETIIRNGVDTYTQVSLALQEIRESRLYRGAYGTFDAYCRDRWKTSARQANRQIAAAKITGIISASDEVTAIMGPNGPAALAESQARELVPLLHDNPSAPGKVWAKAYAAAGDKPPTAALIRQARQEYQQEQADRQQARAQRAAERKQSELDEYIAEHGHAPDHLHLGGEIRWLGNRARGLVNTITGPGFDYAATERASLAAAIGDVQGRLAQAQEVLTAAAPAP